MEHIQSSASQDSRLHLLDYWRVLKARKVIVLMVLLLVVVVVAVFTLLQTKIYAASVRIKVEPERPNVAVFQEMQLPTYDPYFLQTQYEIIQSQKTLYPVIERLNLTTVWGDGATPLPMDFAFKRLKSEMSVRRFRDTSLIEIVVFDKSPQLAADIANTVAELFERQRLEVKRQQTIKGIDKLREELDQQLARVRAAQDRVEQTRRELNVPVFGAAGGMMKLTDQTLQQLEQQLTLARVDAVGRETRVNELKKLSGVQLRNAIATISNDANIQSLLKDLTDSQLHLEVLKQDYGPDHPSVRVAQASLEKVEEQLNDRIEGIMRGFQVEFEMAQARVAELQKQLDAAKSNSLALESEKFLPFRNAQRDEELESHLYETLKARLQQQSIELEVPRSPVEVVDRAEPPAPSMYVKPSLWMNLTVGFIVGGMLGVTLAFAIEFFDTSVKKMDEIEKILGLPVLGVIPQQAGSLAQGDISPAHTESYRMLRTNIEFSRGDAPDVFCVLSAGAGEGKSLTVTNLACVYSQHGARVLVVDADLRRPSLHQLMGVSNEVGLSDYLTGARAIDEIILSSPVENVFVIPSGAQSAKAAQPMLTSHRMNELIQDVSKRFDVVLFDTPPVLGVSDAAIVAREVGLAILVIQHRRYPRAMSRRACQIIENAGSKLLGVVVNNVIVGQDDTYYYYHDQHDRYAPAVAPAEKAVATTARKAGADEIDLPGKY